VDVLKDLFAALMRQTAPQYLPLTRGWDDKAKERAIAQFEEKDSREGFFTLHILLIQWSTFWGTL
jgi:type I restriction enzyme, R subunit